MASPRLDWAHARVQDIKLPSGAGYAKVRAFSLAEAIAIGRIPNHLIPLALEAEEGSGDFNPHKTQEAVGQWLELQQRVVSEAVLEVTDAKGTMRKGPLDPKEVWNPSDPEASMPPIDRNRIFAIATHVVTGAEAQGLVSTFLSLSSGTGRPAAPDGGEGDEPEAESDGGDRV